MNQSNSTVEIEDPVMDSSAIETAQLRQALYRFFCMLFLYPNRARLDNIQAGAKELLAAASLWETAEFAPALQQLLTALVTLNDEAAEQLEEEHNRLLRVKPAAPPYESFYLNPDGQSRGLIVCQLEADYAEAGLAISPSLLDLPDHLAVELEFISFLCAGEVEARMAGDEPANVRARTRQRAFLNDHLVKWFPKFAKRLKEAAPESLYSVIATATFAFVRDDLGYLGLRKA